MSVSSSAANSRSVVKSSVSSSVPPSERRYSASLVQGMGIVHVVAGSLSVTLAMLAFFVEVEANRSAAGLWAGVVYIACGVFGILASTRWYLRRQIAFFMVSSGVSALAAAACITATAAGMIVRMQRIHAERYAKFNDRYGGYQSYRDDTWSTGALTGNIITTAVVELVWSAWSFRTAFVGWTSDETRVNVNADSVDGNASGVSTVSGRKRRFSRNIRGTPNNANETDHFRRVELVMQTRLPSDWSSPPSSGIVVDPRFLTQLRDSVVGLNEPSIGNGNGIAQDSHERKEIRDQEAEVKEQEKTMEKCAANETKERAV